MTNRKFLLRPLIELTIAAAFWGFGFIATIWVLKYLGTPALLFYRFTMAFLAGFAILALNKTSRKTLKHEFGLSFLAGVLLLLTIVLQTWGLRYTTATKSAFITTLYVVLVPIAAHFLTKEKLSPLHWIFVAIALLGTLMITGLHWDAWSFGDSLTLICAFVSTFHILYVDRSATRSKNHFAFNTFQSFWSALFAFSLIPFVEAPRDLMVLDQKAWLGLLSLAFGSTLLGFYLQVRVQEKLDPSFVSLLFLMESPFSFLFAYWLLGERLDVVQSLGAGVILLACAGATLLQRRSKTA